MKPLYTTLFAAALLTISGNALAETKPLFDFNDKERWIVRLRAIDVQPDESSTVSGLAANVEADNRIVPELDFTYFLTDNIGAELILATTKHDMSTDTGIDLGSVWIIPPHLNLQYHFNPEGTFRPYAGAGVGYMYYYNEDSGAVSDISYKSGMSYSLQAGFDYGIDEHWAFNADVKKAFHNTHASINNGAITADVDLDPWIFGVGVAYRF